MNKKLAMAMGLVLAGTSAMVSAEENSMGLEFSANVALTSDYLWRGTSLSDNGPALQGGFDVAHTSGIYAGVWGSNVDAVNDENMELDTYLGWSGDVGPVGLDIGWLRYIYPGEADPQVLDTDEYHIGVSGSVGEVGLGVTYYYSSDYFGADDNDIWDFSAEMPIGQFTVAAQYATQDGDSTLGTDYDWWSIGASTEFGGFGFGLTYMDSDLSPSTDTNSDLWALTISKSL